MGNFPSTITIHFTGSDSPQTLPVDHGANYTSTVNAIFRHGGFWYESPAGVKSYVPWSQITGITAE